MLYISNHCEECEKVVNYLNSRGIPYSVTNIDTETPPVNVFIVPALFLNNKLLAYGTDIIRYLEKHPA